MLSHKYSHFLLGTLMLQLLLGGCAGKQDNNTSTDSTVNAAEKIPQEITTSTGTNTASETATEVKKEVTTESSPATTTNEVSTSSTVSSTDQKPVENQTAAPSIAELEEDEYGVKPVKSESAIASNSTTPENAPPTPDTSNTTAATVETVASVKNETPPVEKADAPKQTQEKPQNNSPKTAQKNLKPQKIKKVSHTKKQSNSRKVASHTTHIKPPTAINEEVPSQTLTATPQAENEPSRTVAAQDNNSQVETHNLPETSPDPADSVEAQTPVAVTEIDQAPKKTKSKFKPLLPIAMGTALLLGIMGFGVYTGRIKLPSQLAQFNFSKKSKIKVSLLKDKEVLTKNKNNGKQFGGDEKTKAS